MCIFIKMISYTYTHTIAHIRNQTHTYKHSSTATIQTHFESYISNPIRGRSKPSVSMNALLIEILCIDKYKYTDYSVQKKIYTYSRTLYNLYLFFLLFVVVFAVLWHFVLLARLWKYVCDRIVLCFYKFFFIFVGDCALFFSMATKKSFPSLFEDFLFIFFFGIFSKILSLYGNDDSCTFLSCSIFHQFISAHTHTSVNRIVWF